MTKKITGVCKPGFVFEYDSNESGELTQLTEVEQKRIFLHFVSRNVQSHMTVKFDGHIWNEGINLTTFERTDVRELATYTPLIPSLLCPEGCTEHDHRSCVISSAGVEYTNEQEEHHGKDEGGQ